MKRAPSLLITDHATMSGDIVPLEQFCADNESDHDLCEQVRALEPKHGFTIGGGAAPAFSITRWA